MLAIIGAAGKVGFTTASALRKKNLPVRAVLRDPAKAAKLEAIGCEVAISDLQQASQLAEALAGADAVQVIVPFRPTTPHPIEDMHVSIDALIGALGSASPARILAVSDYGAHVPQDIGMPYVFHGFEEKFAKLEGRKILLRCAEHMQNIARDIPVAQEHGTYFALQDDLDMEQPTISAHDLGRVAADLWRQDFASDLEVVHAEGPRRYSPNDVASVLSELLDRPVTAQSIPSAQVREFLEKRLPPDLAALQLRTSEAKNKGDLVEIAPNSSDVRHGTTELRDALRPLV